MGASSYPQPQGPVAPSLDPVLTMETPTRKRAGCWYEGWVVACADAIGAAAAVSARAVKTMKRSRSMIWRPHDVALQLAIASNASSVSTDFHRARHLSRSS